MGSWRQLRIFGCRHPYKNAWLIDSAQPDEVNEYLSKHKINFELKAIVNTHHHYDHSDGNPYYHKKYPDLPVIAGKDSPLVTYTPSHEETIHLGDNLTIRALHTHVIHKIQSAILLRIVIPVNELYLPVTLCSSVDVVDF